MNPPFNSSPPTAAEESPVEATSRLPVHVELPPEPVRKTIPTSDEAFREPIAPKAATSKPSSRSNEPTQHEKLSREKRVLLTLSEEREIERCVDRIAEGFGGTPVKLSHVIRSCLAVVRNSESEILRRAKEVGGLTRPPNGDVMALAEFEHELAKVLSQAFRDAPPLR